MSESFVCHWNVRRVRSFYQGHMQRSRNTATKSGIKHNVLSGESQCIATASYDPLPHPPTSIAL